MRVTLQWSLQMSWSGHIAVVFTVAYNGTILKISLSSKNALFSLHVRLNIGICFKYWQVKGHWWLTLLCCCLMKLRIMFPWPHLDKSGVDLKFCACKRNDCRTKCSYDSWLFLPSPARTCDCPWWSSKPPPAFHHHSFLPVVDLYMAVCLPRVRVVMDPTISCQRYTYCLLLTLNWRRSHTLFLYYVEFSITLTKFCNESVCVCLLQGIMRNFKCTWKGKYWC